MVETNKGLGVKKEEAGKFAQRFGISLRLELVGGYSCYKEKSMSVHTVDAHAEFLGILSSYFSKLICIGKVTGVWSTMSETHESVLGTVDRN